MAVVCFGACNTHDNVMLELWLIRLNKRSGHAKQMKNLIELRDRGSLKGSKKMSDNSNILKPGCDPYTLICD